MENTQTLPDYPRGVTFEQVWAILQETAKRQEESAKRQAEAAERRQKELDRIIKEAAERQKEIDRTLKEAQQNTARQQEDTARQIKDTDRQIKEMNKRFGDYSNRLGEIAEYMIAPNLREKFNELGYDFQKTSKNTEVSDRKNNIFMEIDFFLENYSKAMLVEVKTKLTSEHIKEHIERLEKMRKYANLHHDKRTFLGAVAGVVIPENIKENALKQGLYIVEPSGETFNITAPYGKPKEW